MESVTKLFYKLSKEEFNKRLEELKASSISFLKFTKSPFFFNDNYEIENLVTNLHVNFYKFDFLIDELGENIKTHILQSFLIEEIKSTNKIETIFSTKKDIFKTLENIDKENSKDKKIKFIVKAYKNLLTLNSNSENETHESLKKLYKNLFNKIIDKEDKIDGTFYRKRSVFIFDGFENVHKGLSSENEIIKGMDDILKVYNSNNLDLFIKVTLSHFLFEFIHPYYDGNGRFGRFLISKKIYEKTSSILSFFISSSILKNKNKYYKLFKDAENKKEQGSLSFFVYSFLKILNEEIESLILKIKDLKALIDEIYNNEFNYLTSKSEKKVLYFLIETSLFTHFGVSNKEILKVINIKKRNLIYILKKIKDHNDLKETRIGTFKFKKLILNLSNPLFKEDED